MKYVVKDHHLGEKAYAPDEVRDLDEPNGARLVALGVLWDPSEMSPENAERLALEAVDAEMKAEAARRDEADARAAEVMGKVTTARDEADLAEGKEGEAQAELEVALARIDTAKARTEVALAALADATAKAGAAEDEADASELALSNTQPDLEMGDGVKGKAKKA